MPIFFQQLAITCTHKTNFTYFALPNAEKLLPLTPKVIEDSYCVFISLKIQLSPKFNSFLKFNLLASIFMASGIRFFSQCSARTPKRWRWGLLTIRVHVDLYRKAGSCWKRKRDGTTKLRSPQSGADMENE
jgi:hypothetical protein